jgi:hypothetical protein
LISGRLHWPRTHAWPGRPAVVTDDDVRASAIADGSEREPIVSPEARSSSAPAASRSVVQTPPIRREREREGLPLSGEGFTRLVAQRAARPGDRGMGRPRCARNASGRTSFSPARSCAAVHAHRYVSL